MESWTSLTSLNSNPRITKPQLENIKLLLHYICAKVAPHGVRDVADLKRHWKSFVMGWKELKCPKLYYVRADIKDAFPSVNMERLKMIMREAVGEEEDLVIKEFLTVGAAKVMVRSLHSLNFYNVTAYTKI